jgi:hypothetical protein
MPRDDLGRCPGHAGVAREHLDPARGALMSAQKRRERAERRKKTARDMAAEKLEEHAEELLGAAVEAARNGDWRALGWLFDRVYGKAVQPTTTELTVSDPAVQAHLARFRAEAQRGLRLVADDG